MDHAIWQCGCKAVQAEVPAKGNRILCYCASCREFVERLGKGDRLDSAGGSDLMQVSPDGVHITQGIDHLRWMRLTEKGPVRWYASCCNTPMVNTLATRGLPFASFQTHDLTPKEALPPVRAHVHLKGATQRVEDPKGSFISLVFSLLGSAAKARVTGRWRNNPFFDDDGKLIGSRQELT